MFIHHPQICQVKLQWSSKWSTFSKLLQNGHTSCEYGMMFCLANFTLVFSLPKHASHAEISILGETRPRHGLITLSWWLGLDIFENSNENDLTENDPFLQGAHITSSERSVNMQTFSSMDCNDSLSWISRTRSSWDYTKAQTQFHPFQTPRESIVALWFAAIEKSLGNEFFQGSSPIQV